MAKQCEQTMYSANHKRKNKLFAGAVVLLLSLAALLAAGCGQSTPKDLSMETLDSFLTVYQDPSGYTTIQTEQGRYPAGWMSFELTPGIDSYETYQEEMNPGGTVDEMFRDWINSVTTVKLGDYELSYKPFDEWESEFTDEKSDRKDLRYYDYEILEASILVTVPVAFFDSYENDMSTEYLSIESEEFDEVKGYVRFCNYEPDSFTVRVYDKSPLEDGQIQEEYTLTDDELKELNTKSGVSTLISAGSNGLTSFYAEGVYLTDILEALDVDFTSGMTIQPYRANYSTIADAETTYTTLAPYTYESLMETPRYYYPAIWDDKTTYDELGGATVAEMLAESASAWQGDDEQSKALARIIGESKEELEGPLIAWLCNSGVAYWGGPDPQTQTFGEYTFDQYSEYEKYFLLFGMPADADGSIAFEHTTYDDIDSIFGVDIYPTSEKPEE